MKSTIKTITTLAFFGLFFSLTSCGKEDCTAVSNPDCMCTMQYAPVCGCDNKTYGNACVAECAEVDYTPGECP